MNVQGVETRSAPGVVHLRSSFYPVGRWHYFDATEARALAAEILRHAELAERGHRDMKPGNVILFEAELRHAEAHVRAASAALGADEGAAHGLIVSALLSGALGALWHARETFRGARCDGSYLAAMRQGADVAEAYGLSPSATGTVIGTTTDPAGGGE